MKRISHLLLLSTFLASCANAVTPAPNVTVTSEVTVTFTSAPTEVPPTPTETPDSNMPEGATGKDKAGNYIKEIAEGTFTWTVVNGPDGKPVLSIWTDSRIIPSTSDLPSGFPPLIESSDMWVFTGDGEPANFAAQKGFNMPFYSHPDYPTTVDTQNFSSYYLAMIQGYTDFKNRDGLLRINNGEHPLIRFTNGKTNNTWDTTQGIFVIGMNPSELTQEKFTSLKVCTSPDLLDPTVSFTYTVFTEPDGPRKGRMIILTTTAHPENLTPEQALRMWIGPMVNAVSGNVSESNFTDTQRMVNTGLRDVNPHWKITIGPQQ
jgi:hypothetical protein